MYQYMFVENKKKSKVLILDTAAQEEGELEASA